MTSSPLADVLLAAHSSATQARYGATLAPASAAEAYAVQVAVAQGLQAQASGWKVGFRPEGGAFAAPVLSSGVVRSGARWRLAPGIGGVKIEAELAIRFGRDLPLRPGQPYTRDDLLAAIDEIFVGIELVASRFSNVEEAPFDARVADNFNNGAYVIGGGTKTFSALDLSQIRCRLMVDGVVKNDRLGGHGDGDPLIPVVAWANVQADAFGGLRAGQFITTGTLNDPVPLNGPGKLEASLEGIGTVSVEIVV
ncbi:MULTISPECIES: fumarylacetoacetate hydrolase family protein [unclassified Beijerinckia]|uniref:fumarylacetoacetate hydrolase family protein n=1 Tax=unclassified Beijerinckia TaxID=2638183 RepID=UPI00089DA296|nr:MULTISPECIES: fumarylacetoacetate hydrolase family protein [unclassified Beijerinckia]MDH7799335.1 2-keto-4-pentenoate hydratase [Beijerinckia sp. GAS462]SED46656.1 2-keto-4-pentenoate hydratase [Beijerinckia sp. 28-YEA-48]